uniref:Yippee domain-containing protein n=1 Tax=Triticum urartu TaxID=4572 RepID=A0A8R7QYZ4_TRIUA
MGNFASRDASSSVKEAQRVSATSCRPKDSRRKHWDSESIQDWLEMAELAGPRVYSCCHCWNHVCLHDDVISKAFHGRNGRAFLSSHAMNITTGAKEDRQFMTGLHTVTDIHCRGCREVLGWKYERAYEESQKYKEGKFIFEKDKIVQKNSREMAELVGPRVYSCRHCRNHVCLLDDIISKAFQVKNFTQGRIIYLLFLGHY